MWRTEQFDPHRFRADESGATAIVVAVAMTVLIGFAALGVSVAHLFFEQRTLQTRADLAAITAAADISSAVTRAEGALAHNSMTAGDLDSVGYGRFTANPDMAIEDRMAARDASDSDVNAVTVSIAREVPLSFGAIFSDSDTLRLTAEASAANVDAVSFTLGSRLVSLDAGLLNDLLNAAFGTSVTLDLLDYQALADADIALLPFLEALGTDIGFSAGNYVEILDLDADLPDLLDALGVVSPTATQLLITTIAATADNTSVPLDRIISVSDPNLGVDLLDFLGETNVSALDMLFATAEVINASRTVALDADLSVTGLVSLETGLRVSERPAQSGWIMVGEPGSTLHTAQTRLRTEADLDPDLLGSLGVGVEALSLHLPVYAEVAGATASLASNDCRTEAAVDTAVTFDTGLQAVDETAGTHVAELFIGSFDAPDFDSSTPLSASTLDYADFLDLSLVIAVPLLPDIEIGLLTLQIKSHVTVGVSDTGEVTFSAADAAASPTTETFGSETLLTSGVADLLDAGNLDIRVSPDDAGLVTALVAPVVNAVIDLLPGRILSALLTPIDGILDGLLGALGVGVGEADLTLVHQHCGLVRLVR